MTKPFMPELPEQKVPFEPIDFIGISADKPIHGQTVAGIKFIRQNWILMFLFR